MLVLHFFILSDIKIFYGFKKYFNKTESACNKEDFV
ncbi:DUF2648 domain-containing protein [Lactobacillus salivarius]|uniref:DUF2648 domain-containing protein n=1 Tax=Ligilactobacillus salivarius TaxID=1624 RepID=A0ABD6XGZ0_9LACO|nr:DUF2648 domain-containing protein [Ligilactobacillus salivarius]MBC6926940.1 DUF2648 domain-containing protein [Ligilactobacillus salivarius]MYU38863.1 DUF2648 domain-containing protein [Ligilactobacillus salivarius]MYU50304.1 DUF2648 domain-containing protein [Ligilactobacillus salivarius]MYU69901.1 DUF2648 domain-containing protein [Ligilactobacillus salivarius]